MAYNGSGTFVLLYNFVTEAGSAPIEISKLKAEFDGLATGLSTAIARDGQSVVSHDIPFNNKKITGLANAAADADALNRVTADGRFVAKGATDGIDSFTGTLTGMASSTTGTVYYRVVAGIVYLWTVDNIYGTSNANTMTMTGLPAAVQPATIHVVFGSVLDNTVAYQSAQAIVSTDTITFARAVVSSTVVAFSGTGFTTSNSKGLTQFWTLSYPLN